MALIGGQRSRAAYLIAERLGPPAISNARMATIRRDVATIDWIHVLNRQRRTCAARAKLLPEYVPCKKMLDSTNAFGQTDQDV